MKSSGEHRYDAVLGGVCPLLVDDNRQNVTMVYIRSMAEYNFPHIDGATQHKHTEQYCLNEW